MNPVIGILGGMGPRATVQFEQMLLDRLTGTDQNLPAIISLNDGSIPDRSQYLLGRGVSPVPAINRNLRILEDAGASIICIPCNTACVPRIFDRLRPRSSKLINLPQETVRCLVSAGSQKACLLATEGTVQAKTYQKLCTYMGLGCVVPPAKTQRLVNAVIRTVKSGDMAAARTIAFQVAGLVADMECDTVILGCTELPLVQNQLVPRGCRAVDTLAILADACVRYTNNTQGENSYDARPIYS